MPLTSDRETARRIVVVLMTVFVLSLLAVVLALGEETTTIALQPLHQARLDAFRARLQALQAESELVMERSGLRKRQRDLDEERTRLLRDLQETYKVKLGNEPGQYDLAEDGKTLTKVPVPVALPPPGKTAP